MEAQRPEDFDGRIGYDAYLMRHLPHVRPIALEIQSSLASRVELEALVLGGINELVLAATQLLPESEADIAIRRAVLALALGSEDSSDPEHFMAPHYSAKLWPEAEEESDSEAHYCSLVKRNGRLLEKKYDVGLSAEDIAELGLIEDELVGAEFRRAERKELACGETRFTRIEAALSRVELALDGLESHGRS